MKAYHPIEPANARFSGPTSSVAKTNIESKQPAWKTPTMKRQNATTQKTFANDIANEPRSTTNNEGKKTLLRPYLSAKMPRTIAPTAQPKNKMACASQAKKARLQTRSNWKTSTIIYLKAVDSMTWLLFSLIMLSTFRRVWSNYSFVLVRLNRAKCLLTQRAWLLPCWKFGHKSGQI